MPLVMQARPCCAPESHVPASPTLAPVQRGQTCVGLVRKMRDWRFTVPVPTPVEMSALKPVILGFPKLFTTQTGMFGGEERQRRAERRSVDHGGLCLVLRALRIRGRAASGETHPQLGVGHHGEVLARARPPVVEIRPGIRGHQPQLARAALWVGVAVSKAGVGYALQLDDVLVLLGLRAGDGDGRERDLGRRHHLPLLVHLEREPDDALGGAGRAGDWREGRRRRRDREPERAHLDGLRLGLDRHLLDGLRDALGNVRLRDTDADAEHADTVLGPVDVAGRITVLAG